MNKQSEENYEILFNKIDNFLGGDDFDNKLV